MSIKYIPLSGGQLAIVDEVDYDSVKDYKWHLNLKTGYVYRYGINPKTGKRGSLYLHRQVMGFPDKLVDHENGMKTDCRKKNLRLATPSQSRQNTRKQKKKSSSKYKGVTRSGNRWRSQLSHNRKHYYLGTYIDENEAALAYNRKAIELFGEFAVINHVV